MTTQVDIFSRDDLRRIEAETFVRHVEFHRELPSTSDLALELAAGERIASPLLVLVEHQSTGRGRGTNRWWSLRGSLTFSLVVEAADDLPMDRWPHISLTSGLAVCDALAAFAPQLDVGLKWPNDVFLGGLKACGILVEVPPRRRRFVIGIGINVNNSFAAAPDELRTIATSLYDTTQRHFELTDVLIAVLGQFERRLQMLHGGDPSLVSDWQRRSILDGRRVSVQLGEKQISGTCRGINPQGALLIETPRGVEPMFAGTVTAIEP